MLKLARTLERERLTAGDEDRAWQRTAWAAYRSKA